MGKNNLFNHETFVNKYRHWRHASSFRAFHQLD